MTCTNLLLQGQQQQQPRAGPPQHPFQSPQGHSSHRPLPAEMHGTRAQSPGQPGPAAGLGATEQFLQLLQQRQQAPAGPPIGLPTQPARQPATAPPWQQQHLQDPAGKWGPSASGEGTSLLSQLREAPSGGLREVPSGVAPLPIADGQMSGANLGGARLIGPSGTLPGQQAGVPQHWPHAGTSQAGPSGLQHMPHQQQPSSERRQSAELRNVQPLAKPGLDGPRSSSQPARSAHTHTHTHTHIAQGIMSAQLMSCWRGSSIHKFPRLRGGTKH